MADQNRKSVLQSEKESRTKSLMGSLKGSFKMAQSLMGSATNKKTVTLKIPGIKLADQNQFKKQQVCQVCFIGFGKLTRQHHCRVCANAVCSSCSGSSINKQRCCDVCAYKNIYPDKETSKANILFQLQGAAILFVQTKNACEQELKKVNQQFAQTQIKRKYYNYKNNYNKQGRIRSIMNKKQHKYKVEGCVRIDQLFQKL